MAKEAIIVRHGAVGALPVLGTNVRFLLEAERTENHFSLMEVELPEGQGPPPHDHPWDEAYYIIEGKVWFLVGENEQIVAAGDFLYVPGNTVHSFRGIGKTGARVLVLDVPATAGGFFKEASREIKNFPDDISKVPAIGAKYGMRFLRHE